jgi:lambda family phage portal protein
MAFETIRTMLGISRPPDALPPALQAPKAAVRSTPHTAGSSAPRTVGWDAPDVAANVAATASAATIRARCRDAMRNDAWAKAIVETLTDDLIGWGVKPLSRAKGEPFRQAIMALWDDWSAVADADGVLDMAGLQSLAVRNWAVDGETFIRLRRRKREDGLPVPLQLQILPAEICPVEHTMRAENGDEIKQGIEYNAIGQRIAYWFRETPPGEDDSVSSSARLHRVPADQVIHLFEPLRPGQRRGVSMLAPALVRLRELDLYADATLLRLQLSAMFVGTVRPAMSVDAQYDPITGERLSETSTEPRVLRLQPGTFQELNPGEELTFNNPPTPPEGFETFIKHELRAAGAAVGVPLEAFTHEWGATNDRLARVVLNQYRRRVHRLLWSIVVPQFLRPVWNAWFSLALAGESLPVTDTYLEDRLGRVTFAPHAHAYVHPVQDVASYREAIRAGLTSRAAAVAETGEDVEVIEAQIAADNARADALGLAFTSDARPDEGGVQ